MTLAVVNEYSCVINNAFSKFVRKCYFSRKETHLYDITTRFIVTQMHIHQFSGLRKYRIVVAKREGNVANWPLYRKVLVRTPDAPYRISCKVVGIQHTAEFRLRISRKDGWEIEVSHFVRPWLSIYSYPNWD